ncbi:MAG: hypothetical protein RQ754_02935 [Desulfuromonadales bacterium]|nr:hypothetical protein [Desulfuromonadales bacterium]
MRWFKHIATTHQAEDGAAIIDTMGAEGYGVWWIILEVIASQMDSTDKCSANYSAKKWGSFCGFSAKRFQKFAEKLAEFSSISVKETGEFLEIECPNLLKYRDEYSKKSGQAPEKVRTKIQRQKQKQKQSTEKNKNLSSGKPADEYFGLESVTDQDLKDWKTLFPDVNIHSVIKKAVTYRDQHPDRREEDLKIRDWLVKAFQKEQDKIDKEKIVTEWFETVWERYPRKDGKKAAFRSFRASVQSEAALNAIHQALRNYLQHLANEGTEPRYIKAGSTWFNNWRDWLEWAPIEPTEPPSTRSRQAQGSEVLAEMKRRIQNGMAPAGDPERPGEALRYPPEVRPGGRSAAELRPGVDGSGDGEYLPARSGGGYRSNS